MIRLGCTGDELLTKRNGGKKEEKKNTLVTTLDDESGNDRILNDLHWNI